MSVPTWLRRLSGADYVYQTYVLNIEIGKILANKPKKYKPNYSDGIIKSALSALKHLQMADSIYLSKYSFARDYFIRRDLLLKARGEIQHVATAIYVFLEIVRKHDHGSERINAEQMAKIFEQEIRIGGMCEKCFKLISGIIKSDINIYMKHIKPRTGG